MPKDRPPACSSRSSGPPRKAASRGSKGGPGCLPTWVYKRHVGASPIHDWVAQVACQPGCTRGIWSATLGSPGCYCNLGSQEASGARPAHGTASPARSMERRRVAQVGGQPGFTRGILATGQHASRPALPVIWSDALCRLRGPMRDRLLHPVFGHDTATTERGPPHLRPGGPWPSRSACSGIATDPRTPPLYPGCHSNGGHPCGSLLQDLHVPTAASYTPWLAISLDHPCFCSGTARTHLPQPPSGCLL